MQDKDKVTELIKEMLFMTFDLQEDKNWRLFNKYCKDLTTELLDLFKPLDALYWMTLDNSVLDSCTPIDYIRDFPSFKHVVSSLRKIGNE